MKSFILKLVLIAFAIVTYRVYTDCGGAEVYTDYCNNHNKLMVLGIIIFTVQVVIELLKLCLRKTCPRKEWEKRWFDRDED